MLKCAQADIHTKYVIIHYFNTQLLVVCGKKKRKNNKTKKNKNERLTNLLGSNLTYLRHI